MVCEEPPLVGGYKEELVGLPGAVLVSEEHDVGFFGFDDNKLNRVKGIPPRWFDRFCNKRWLIWNTIFVALLVNIVVP